MHQYYKIYKPYGYLSQFVNHQNKRRNKKLLGELGSFDEHLMAIGRLDEKSEGLLLLTTNGKYSEYIRSKQIEKEYYVEVDGLITPAAIERLKNGVDISVEKGIYRTNPCEAFMFHSHPDIPKRFVRHEKHGPTSWISITITEGKFRQVRKMTAAVGFPTLRLVRYRIGGFVLDGMLPGTIERLEGISF